MARLTAIGVPAGIYIASIVSLMELIVREQVNWFIALCAGILAVSIYAFHRASISVGEGACDRLQRRHHIVLQHKTTCIKLSVIAFVCAVVGLASEDAALGLLPLAGFAGILLYGKPILVAPLRSIPLLKPLIVGFGIALFGFCLFAFELPLPAFIAFGLICSADALLCDVEDIPFDTACGCTTLASTLSHRMRVIVVMSMYAVSAVFLPITIGVGVIALSIPFFWQRFVNRTYIDIRPVFILLLAWLL